MPLLGGFIYLKKEKGKERGSRDGVRGRIDAMPQHKEDGHLCATLQEKKKGPIATAGEGQEMKEEIFLGKNKPPFLDLKEEK